ncbi:MAG: DUF2924 domain-containing protein [Rhizobiales bacterium]|nr:DUF2924 domain-containing protein [Hyphomicrobiales bacterium]
MDVSDEVRALAKLDGPQLRQRWQDLVGRPAPSVSPKLLRLALAWHIQATAMGGLSAAARRKLAQAAGGKSTTQPARAGTKLMREWQGSVHVVIIDENGIIRWNDREWTSLSAVVRAITGGHWSGPAFFGLRKTLRVARDHGSHEARTSERQTSRPSSKMSSVRVSSSSRTDAVPKVSQRGRAAS